MPSCVVTHAGESRDDPTTPGSTVGKCGTVKFSAATALPYEHLERATAGLRAELCQRLLHTDVHQMPMWDTFTVTGPREFTDLRGRRWFEYRASVESRGPFDRTSSAAQPT
jgi:hypothetical protein